MGQQAGSLPSLQPPVAHQRLLLAQRGEISSPSSQLTSWLLFARELLNEERVPSFFLDAMKSTIKRQRKKIRAKMLGTMEESASR